MTGYPSASFEMAQTTMFSALEQLKIIPPEKEKYLKEDINGMRIYAFPGDVSVAVFYEWFKEPKTILCSTPQFKFSIGQHKPVGKGATVPLVFCEGESSKAGSMLMENSKDVFTSTEQIRLAALIAKTFAQKRNGAVPL